MSYEAGIGQQSLEGEFGEWEYGEFGEGEFGEGEGESQIIGEILGSGVSEGPSGLSEAQEVQLASELLEITSEQELEQFLGKLFKGVVRGVGNFVRSPIGRAVGGVLKSVAKRALPVVGGAIGSFVAPGIGTAIGSRLGGLAGGMFEIPTGAMPQEQAEFEVARRYVRLASSAARSAAAARPRAGINPWTVARASVARAARVHAPGLHRDLAQSLRTGMRPQRPPFTGRRPRPWSGRPVPYADPFAPVAGSAIDGAPGYGPADDGTNGDGDGVTASGRWVRRGNEIVVIGA